MPASHRGPPSPGARPLPTPSHFPWKPRWAAGAPVPDAAAPAAPTVLSTGSHGSLGGVCSRCDLVHGVKGKVRPGEVSHKAWPCGHRRGPPGGGCRGACVSAGARGRGPLQGRAVRGLQEGGREAHRGGGQPACRRLHDAGEAGQGARAPEQLRLGERGPCAAGWQGTPRKPGLTWGRSPCSSSSRCCRSCAVTPGQMKTCAASSLRR